MFNTLPPNDIDDMEMMRKRNMKLICVSWGIIWVVATFAMYKVLTDVESGMHLVFIIAAFGCAVCFWAFTFFDSDYRKNLKQTFMQKLADENDMHYAIDGVFRLESTHKHHILPTYDLSSIEDGFTGNINDVPFAIQEVRLENIETDSKGRKRTSETFKGLVIKLNLKKDLDFHTIAVPRSPVMTWLKTNASWRTRDFKKVGLSSKFEKKFDVISTDQIESRVIFDPAFMERFLDLCGTINAKSFSASFKQDELLIIAPSRKNHFELGHVFKKLSAYDFVIVLDDLKIIGDIIQTLKLNPHTGL